MHDIFVSYAHADNEVPARATTGWVTTFVDELTKILRRKLGGSSPDIWTDERLAPNAIVDVALQNRVQNSRTIVLFMSPGYLMSDWCVARELDVFLAERTPDGEHESVFVV